MPSTHKHIRSSTANKRPTTAIADGQIALNTNSTSPGLFFKDSTGATIIKIGPVHVGTTAPNVSPASGGSSGNSTGEVWLDTSLTPNGVKIWNGSSWTNATPIGSTTVQGLLELATNAETQTGTDIDRAVTPAGLQSKVSDSVSTTSSTTIASSTAVKAAYDLAVAAVPLSGGTVTGNLEIGTTGSLSFEGATADGFETTLAVTNPTADRTITLPNVSGTVVTTGDTGTVTSTMIADGTIVDADVSASAEIAVSKLADGAARQLLQTDAAGTGVEWTSNVDVPGTLDVTSTATFDSIASHPLGAAATPSITFTGDTNTGIYSPGADQVAISTNGTGRITIDGSGNVNIDSNTLYVDATNNRVGIGTTSPGGKFQINVQDGFLFDVGAGAYAYMRFGSQGAGEGVAELGNDRTSGKVLLKTGATGSTLNTRLEIDAAGATIINNQSGTERARIDSSGRLLVGTSSVYNVPTGDGAVRSPGLQRAATTFADSSISSTLFNTAADGGGTLTLSRSNTTTLGAQVIAAAQDATGSIWFSASDGVTQIPTASIVSRVDGTPGTNDMPGRLVFSTTADGASSPTERMRISNAGTTTLTSAASTAPFIANIGASEAARIDSSGRLLVGASNARSVGGVTSQVQVEGVTLGTYSQSWVRNVAGTNGALIILGKSRSASVGGVTIVNANDQLGGINFAGADNVDLNSLAASIESFVDGTPGTDDMPGRIVLSTTADGAALPTERFRITNDGVIAHDQPAPAAVNATATLTVANLKAGIITSTSAAATDMTLPTGTDTQAGFSGTYDNFTFEWSVINTGPSLVRVLAGTAHTVVGSGSVATGTSGRFASRRTAANTFVSYRLS